MLPTARQAERARLAGILPAWAVVACLAVGGSAIGQVSVNDSLVAQAQAKIQANQYADAMPLLLQSANHGSAAAMRQLGLVYSGGLSGRRPDAKWGLQWFQRAAVSGDVPAAFYVAEVYAQGTIGRPNYALARFWYAKGDKANDADGAMGLAELACGGLGQNQDLGRCNDLLTRATVLRTANGSDPTRRMVTDWHALGVAYAAAGPQLRNRAALAFQHASAMGDSASAMAECKLYLNARSSPRDLAKATAALDSFVSTYSAKHPGTAGVPGYEFAPLYVEIGDRYSKLGEAQTRYAVAVYASAAARGVPLPAIRLAMRYAKGDGVAKDLPAAARQLLALQDPYPFSPDAEEYLTSLQSVAEAYSHRPQTPANAAMAKALAGRIREIHQPKRLPTVAQYADEVTASASAASTVTPQNRFPNMIAPATIKPLQKFPVMVSLNTSRLDNNTVTMSGGLANGEVQINLPPGMTAVQIGVTLIAPAMTVVDGVYMQNIELTKDQDSTTAIFQLQAGAAAGTSPMFATLTYNGAFLAQIKRNVVVADAGVATDPPAPSSPAATPKTLGPRFVSMEAPIPPQPPVRLDPEQRAPDMTIQEVQLGDSLTYTVYAPGFGFAGPTVVTGAAQRQAIVAKLYSDLENQGNVLDQLGGKSASQQARDFAEGKGNDLYDQMAPDAFKTMYQKMMAAGSPPRTIQVLTSSPSLPWELLRPVLADGPRQDFLGTSVAIVTVDAASTPRVPPPLAVPVNTVKVVAPHYDGDLSLAGAQKEVIALKASFPALDTVDGSVDAVSALGRSLPNGIIHYAGHGIRVTTPGLPPDVALSLSDGTIVPSTWKNLAEQNPNAHPFYFFNACDLGRSDVTLDYMSGWAPMLMQSGASGYLGALWKVSDTTATSFAKHFYTDLNERMQSGEPWSIAEVVTDARRETYQEAFDPTALAYILYSDPYATMTANE